MSKLNVLEVTELNDNVIDEIIDKLDGKDLDSGMIMGFGTDKEGDGIAEFAEKLKDRIAERAMERERADKPAPSTSIDDYTSLADVPDEMRKHVMTAVIVKAIIGKESSWNDLLVSNDLLKSLRDD